MNPMYVFAALGTGISIYGAQKAYEATAIDEELRQRELESERTSAELAALEEENERMQELRYANADLVTSFSGSATEVTGPSILALRKYNLSQTEKDLKAIRLNLATSRASIRNQILMSKNRKRAAGASRNVAIASSLLKGGMQVYEAHQ